MKALLLAVSVATLAACSSIKLPGGSSSHPAYLDAKSLPALKVPKRLQKTTYLQPAFNVPAGKLARATGKQVSDYPPQFVKP